MTSVLLLVLMLTGAIAAGLTIGKSLKHLFVGLGITVLCALPLVFMATFKIDMLKKTIITLLSIHYITFLPSLVTAQKISGVMIWSLIFFFTLLAIFVYVAVFNCRKNAENIYVALGGTVLIGLVFYFCSVWVFYGLSTFVQIFREYSYKFPTLGGVIATGILTIAMLSAWTVFSFKNKRKGWKILTVQIAIFAGIYAIAWLLALVVAYPYAWHAENQAQKNAVSSCYFVNKFPPEAQAEKEKIDSFWEKHKGFELPYESIYHWTKNTSDNYQGQLIPQAKREYTLKYFNSPDFNERCRSLEKLLEYTPSKGKNILYLPIINCTRSYARTCAGKAALYRETNQPEKILSELMKITLIDADYLNNSPFLSAELARIACRSLWYGAMVQLGPNDKGYAPIYRQALNLMKSRKVHLPNESGFFLHMLSNDIYALSVKELGTYATCLAMPSTMITAAKGVLASLAIRPELEKLERQEVFGDYERQQDNMISTYRQVAPKSRISIVVGTTALALKLYRVEHGAYPDMLKQLVPEYLDKVPLCPFSGKPLKYKLDGDNFTLSYGYEKHRKIHKLSSEAAY